MYAREQKALNEVKALRAHINDPDGVAVPQLDQQLSQELVSVKEELLRYKEKLRDEQGRHEDEIATLSENHAAALALMEASHESQVILHKKTLQAEKEASDRQQQNSKAREDALAIKFATAEQQQVKASANAAEVEELRQKISEQEEVEEKNRNTPISDLGFSGAFFCGPIFEFFID